jgi:hypothetical protein
MALDIVSATTSFFNTLATDSAGSAVRAQLVTYGSSASSIVPADFLKKYNNASPMPVRPLIAYRGSVITGNSRTVNEMFVKWFIYDDEQFQYYRINTLIPLIVAAYPENAIPHAYIEYSGASQEAPDPAYQMPVRSLTFVIKNRQ